MCLVFAEYGYVCVLCVCEIMFKCFQNDVQFYMHTYRQTQRYIRPMRTHTTHSTNGQNQTIPDTCRLVSFYILTPSPTLIDQFCK